MGLEKISHSHTAGSMSTSALGAITSVDVKLCKMKKCAHFTQYEQKKFSH